MQRTGGQLIVDCLEAQGVERIFCIPGESYLAVLDAFYDANIRTVICRQESGVAMAAEATGKATGRPGIAFVTRGPGATNAAAGVHIAQQDSSPMILFVGQVARSMRGRDAFQEIDYQQFYGSIAKWVVEIDDAARIPELVSRAFRVAMSGRPGPVVVALPEDMLTDSVTAPAPRPVEAITSAPSAQQMAQFGEMLRAAERPFIILGGARWQEADVAGIQKFAEEWQLPISVSFRRQMLFDHLHQNYAGDVGIGINPALRKRIEDADLLIMLGARLPEMASQSYDLLDIPYPKQKLIHVHSAAEELGSLYQPDLAINATPSTFLDAVETLPPVSTPVWSSTPAAAHSEYLNWSEVIPPAVNGMHMGEVIGWLRENAPQDTIYTNGAGNYNTWLHRYFRFRSFASQIGPTSGSMGYGLPAAIAMKLQFPARPVICLAGDGCFQMTSQEFSTAVQAKASMVVLVADNGMYGTIRMHQERDYPARISATDIENPDFAKIAQACGGYGEHVSSIDEFGPAFERAMGAGVPALLHLHIDPEAITPTTTLTKLRNKT